MIIRKPYAFLIKRFRLIHGFLFIMLLYLLVRTVNIYSFFSNYASAGTYVNTGNLDSMYINYLMFFATILTIGVSFVIYYLLSIKKKSAKAYLSMVVFYVILFVYYIYMYSVFRGLNETSISIPSRTLMVDIGVIAMIPQVVFIFIIFGRTLGFNLKQFDFKSDLEEINIDSSDNEEVEITLGNDTYKIARLFRKMLRLSKYFILENKIFVIGCGSIFALVISLSLYMKLNVYNVSYVENQAVIASSLRYTVLESYIANTDLSNNVLEKEKSYVLVKIDVSNEYGLERTMDRDTFRLEAGKYLISPSFTLGEKFIDLGDGFVPTEMRPGQEKEFLVIFEIDSTLVQKDYKLKIKNIRSSIANIDSAYREILINPINLNEVKDMGKKPINSTFTLNNLIFKNTDFSLINYEIADSFTEDWNYCTNSGVCRKNGKYTIFPETANKNSSSVIKITSTLKYKDKDSLNMQKYVNYPADLLGYYGYINYTYLGNNKTTKLVKIADSDFEPDKYAYFQVPSELKKASKIDLILSIRGNMYTFNLK